MNVLNGKSWWWQTFKRSLRFHACLSGFKDLVSEPFLFLFKVFNQGLFMTTRTDNVYLLPGTLYAVFAREEARREGDSRVRFVLPRDGPLFHPDARGGVPYRADDAGVAIVEGGRRTPFAKDILDAL